MKGWVRYRQPRDCGQCFIRIYGPDLDQLTEAAGETTAGWHDVEYDWVEAEIDEDYEPVGTYTAVLFTLETEEQGAGDRGPEQKWHKQKGTTTLLLAPDAWNHDGPDVQLTGPIAKGHQANLSDGTKYDSSSATGVIGYDAVEIMAHDNVAIVQLHGHGIAGGGYIQCTPNSAVKGYYLPGKVPTPGYGYIQNQLSPGDLDEVLLVVFEGCYTALTDDDWGNLLDESVAKGADCAVGFLGIVDPDYAQVWAEEFWDSLADGDWVDSALDQAKDAVDDETFWPGDYAGYETYDASGDLSICPARFGS